MCVDRIPVFDPQTRTQADMVFDLSRFLDFSLKFLDTDLEGITEMIP